MPKCPPFRHIKQLKNIQSRNLLVYKYIIGKITKNRPIYCARAAAYLLPGYFRTDGGVYDVVYFSFDNEL